jgi:hypothetical protein
VRQGRPAAIPGHERDGGGHSTTGTVTHHGDPRRIDIELGRVLDKP